MILTIYVPATDYAFGIVPGSAIVGSTYRTALTGPVCIDFEGNLHGASNIVTFEDKLKHAAGRHVEHYPTVARRWVQTAKLRAVGAYDTDTWSVVEITDKAALDAWIEQGGQRD